MGKKEVNSELSLFKRVFFMTSKKRCKCNLIGWEALSNGGVGLFVLRSSLYKKFRVLAHTHVKVNVHDKSELYTHIFTFQLWIS